MQDKIITDTLETVEQGDTIKLRIESDESDYVTVREYEVIDTDPHRPETNGDYKLERTDTEHTRETFRLFVTEDGISITQRWSPSDQMVTAVALEDEDMAEPEYEISVERNAEGEITKSELVRTDKPNAAHQF